ncbi:hypothetical protein OJAV_G00179650 [Oryzias javanicus]|uniref:Uncharacterized protein n=1 Tax=Oryzias javanicus TaxID=123683 RepID=A0A3S2NZ93_ORYJA|nr:hypothetical protein OJAV_G00179650 [Oryzias javanicus]
MQRGSGTQNTSSCSISTQTRGRGQVRIPDPSFQLRFPVCRLTSAEFFELQSSVPEALLRLFARARALDYNRFWFSW